MIKLGKFPFAFEMFIARRMIKPGKGSFSGPIMLISIISLVLGLSVMIVSVVVLTGFKKEIREKVTGFTGHIHIAKYTANNSLELPPLVLDSIDAEQLQKIEGVSHLQKFITKAAIIRTDSDMHGVMVKGVGADFDSLFFHHNMVIGRLPLVYGNEKSNEILISDKLSQLLHIHLGDKLRVYFVNNVTGKVRGRRFIVCGVYQTSVDEFDERMVLVDIRQLQKINNWQSNQVSGLEIFVEDYARMNEVADIVYEQIPYDLSTETVSERYPQIFDWLELQDVNVIVILVLIILVATVSMISTLLVLILERTQMIGILKSLGATNSSIRNVFLSQAAYIILIGLAFGNILGIGLAYLQKTYGLVKLDPGTYYMSVVPVNLDFMSILVLNISTLLLVLVFMIFPVMLISRIQPVKAIRFD